MNDAADAVTEALLGIGDGTRSAAREWAKLAVASVVPTLFAHPGGLVSIEWPSDKSQFATVTRSLVEEAVKAHNESVVERDRLRARVAELEAALALARRDLSEARAQAAAAASEKRP